MWPAPVFVVPTAISVREHRGSDVHVYHSVIVRLLHFCHSSVFPGMSVHHGKGPLQDIPSSTSNAGSTQPSATLALRETHTQQLPNLGSNLVSWPQVSVSVPTTSGSESSGKTIKITDSSREMPAAWIAREDEYPHSATLRGVVRPSNVARHSRSRHRRHRQLRGQV